VLAGGAGREADPPGQPDGGGTYRDGLLAGLAAPLQ
jgi:hypothetical protein